MASDMRLFIAIELGPFVPALRNMQEALKGHSKMTYPKCFHLTLKFLGDVPDEKAAEIVRRLRAIRCRGFELALDRPGVFPKPDMIRVVWAGIGKSALLARLQSEVDEVLADMFQKEKDFVPHVTLARVKYVTDRKALNDAIGSIEVPDVSVHVSEFCLIRSTLAGSGPDYDKMASFGLED